jgi:hypothetical protein
MSRKPPEKQHQPDKASPHADYHPQWFDERLSGPRVAQRTHAPGAFGAISI